MRRLLTANTPRTARTVTLTRVLLLAVLCSMLPGCDSGTEPEPDLTGTWTGIVQGGGNSANWTIQVTDRGGQLSGTFTANNPTLGSVALTGSFSGTYDHPSVVLSFQLTAPPDPTLDCEVRATVNSAVDQMSGSLTCQYLGQDVLGGTLSFSR